MSGKEEGDNDLRERLRRIEEALQRIGGVWGGLAAIAFVIAAVFSLTRDDGKGSAPQVDTLAEYCERTERYAAAWLEFTSSASAGEASPGDLGAALDNLWATHAVAPAEVEDELELLAGAVEQLDEDLSGNPLEDALTFASLFVTNAPVSSAMDRIDAFDAEHCGNRTGG